VAIVDGNGQQALGHTDQVLDMSPLAERWRVWGWDAVEVDGHDMAALTAALDRTGSAPGKPHVVVAQTIAGKGVSYMERQVKWHYLPMDDAQYAQALREIGAPA
ncbi:MAG: transketolase, partial [Chloroflexi bacterium]|nr:transketolase [Chloroflexota bacterium]